MGTAPAIRTFNRSGPELSSRLDEQGMHIMVELPKGAPKLEEILLNTGSLPWREKSLKGVSEKMLWRNEETGASVALIKFAKGAGIPEPHLHSSNQFMFCLSGK